MSRSLKAEIRLQRTNMLWMLGFVLASAVFGYILMNIIVIAVGNEAQSWVPMGSFFACMMLVGVVFVMEALAAMKQFNLAVQMGQTRKGWFLFHFLVQLIYSEVLALAVTGVVYLEKALVSAFHMELPMEPVLTMDILGWLYPALPLIMSIGLLCGILALKFGRVMVGIYMVLWIGFCLNSERVSVLVVRLLRPAGGWLDSAAGNFSYPVGSLILLLIAGAVMGIGWILLRKQMAS